MVNTAVHPCSTSRRMPSNALTAPRLLEPRTGTNPNFRMIRAMYSPSKLWLVITRIWRLRHINVAAKTHRCQNAIIKGRGAKSGSAPSSDAAELRRVGPMHRIGLYAVQVRSQFMVGGRQVT